MGEPFNLHLRLKHFSKNQVLHEGRRSLQTLLFFLTWCESSNFSMPRHVLPTVSSLPSLSLRRGDCLWVLRGSDLAGVK